MTEDELRDDMIERGEMDENGNLIEEVEKEPTKENIDWKKRHDDGRRFQIQLQNRVKEQENRISELEEKLSQKVDVPENMDEFNQWVENYPKVYEMVKIAARKEASSLDETIKKKLSRVDELDKKEKLIAEKQRLNQLQPDFYQHIAPSEEWRDWILNKAPEKARLAVFDDVNPDAEQVSLIIDSFKVQTGWSNPTTSTKKKTTVDDASSIRPRSNQTQPKVKTTGEWSESRVLKMSDADFEKYEEEIYAAQRDGTFVYDIRDAQ